MEKVPSVCGYCGTGCGLYLQVEGDQVVGVEPDPQHPVSQGSLCLKGYYGFKHLRDPQRLTTPLRQKDGVFTPITWEEALDDIARQLTRITRESGADAFALFASARATNEENFVAQKFARAVIGTHNVDHCARL